MVEYLSGERIQGLAPVPTSTHTQSSSNTLTGIDLNQPTGGGGWGIKITSSHTLVGKKMTSITFNMRIVNAQNYATQTITLKHFGSAPATIRATGSTMSTDDVATSSTDYTFTFANPVTIQADDFIMLTVPDDIGTAGGWNATISDSGEESGSYVATWIENSSSFSIQTGQSRKMKYSAVYESGDGENKPTNVPEGTRYEETNTRKIYRKVTPTVNTYTFNGTSGWDFRSGTSGTITGGNVVCTGMSSSAASSNNNVHDLQDELGSGNNASATAWVLRGKYKNSTTSNYVFFGLTSVDQTNAPNNSPQDYIGWSSYKTHSSMNGLDIRDNGSPDPTGTGNTASVNNTNWYWIEIVRDSSSATLKLYTEANEFTGTPAFTYTKSIPSGVENLRYIKFGATHNGGGSAYLTDVKFYNGATSVDTDEWKERGSA